MIMIIILSIILIILIIIMIIIIMIIMIMIIIIIYTSHHLPISSLPVSLVGPKFCSLNLLSWVKNGCPQPFSQWAWQQLRLLGRKEAQSCPPDNPEQGIGLQSHWKEWKKAWKKDEKKGWKKDEKGWKRMVDDERALTCPYQQKFFGQRHIRMDSQNLTNSYNAYTEIKSERRSPRFLDGPMSAAFRLKLAGSRRKGIIMNYHELSISCLNLLAVQSRYHHLQEASSLPWWTLVNQVVQSSPNRQMKAAPRRDKKTRTEPSCRCAHGHLRTAWIVPANQECTELQVAPVFHTISGTAFSLTQTYFILSSFSLCCLRTYFKCWMQRQIQPYHSNLPLPRVGVERLHPCGMCQDLLNSVLEQQLEFLLI